MKKYKLLLLSLSLMTIAGGCDWLDVDPELGLSDEDVFSTYKNYCQYFDYIFTTETDYTPLNIHEGYPMYVDYNSRRFSFVATTDAADAGRLLRAQQEVKIGNLSQETVSDFSFGGDRPIAEAMFKIIHVANRSIDNIGLLTNARPTERADILGQAYFVRGYAHFVLCRFFGGMPYINEASRDDWDMERLSAHDTYTLAAEDMYTAYQYLKDAGKMRRDAAPGVAGHLNASDMDRPSGCTALAMRARALMYAASPLNNERGIADWQDAADAYALALSTALENQYMLQDAGEYTDNFFGKTSTNEVLWGYAHSGKPTLSSFSGITCYPQSYYTNASGICPTQNFVDRYETIYGDPLETEEERAAAVLAGHYNEQNPYANRDPRLELTILHDRSTTPYVEGFVNIHCIPSAEPEEKWTWPTTKISSVNQAFGIPWGTNDKKGYTNTGYYCRKQWRGARGDKDKSYYLLSPMARLAELYLGYAECVNEVSGPSGTAGSVALTAVEAVNTVRHRIGMPDVLDKFTGSADAFRERIRNERCVELAYEDNHYYFDIRRWKIAPELMTKVLYGMYIKACDEDTEHPVGRIYERRPIPSNRQGTWKNCMYTWPFPDSEANKLLKFVNNERWQ